MIDLWLIGGAAALVAWLMWRYVSARTKSVGRSGSITIPPGVSLTPQALLTEPELMLYNLIRMAVQDRYLVFTQIPLWCILSVEGEDEVRRQMLRQLALKRVDMVCVHPGSRQVEQVIQFEDESSDEQPSSSGHDDIRDVLQSAGIRVTRLRPGQRYSVQELERLLDVGDPE